jgi:hypothetical protein
MSKIEEILKDNANKPLVIVDKIIESFKQKKDDSQAQMILSSLAKSICKYLNLNEEEYKNCEIDYLFKKDLEFRNQKFISICLLRVFTYSKNLFGGGAFYHKTMELFDNIFKSNLYSKLNIDLKKDEPFKKLNKLTSLINELEIEIRKIISSLDSLDAIEVFKKKYESVLNNKYEYSFILKAFVPQEFFDVKLNEIFNLLPRFLEAEKEEFLVIYNETLESLNNYKKQAMQYNTRYVEEYVVGLIEKIIYLINKEFKKNPICQPTKVIVEKGEKKYPLTHLNEIIDLNLIIKNLGPGHAFETSIELKEKECTDIEVIEKNRFLGYLEQTFISIDLPVKIINICSDIIISGICRWKDYSNEIKEEPFDFIIEAQNPNVDWAKIENEKPQPYSLKPVSKEQNLIGRKVILRELKKLSKSREGVGSHVIYGQRRVGKTSLVQALANLLKKDKDKNFKVFYTRAGHFHFANDPKETLNTLVNDIYKDITQDDRFADISPPDQKGSFSTISAFLKNVIIREPDYKILFIIDDFDFLTQLYYPGEISESFFNTIKALSSDENFGFILVGGEMMQYFKDKHQGKANLFKWKAVDYFNKDEWEDFRELVRKPLSDYLFEFTEDAILYLYKVTSGNPYYTNLICGNLFSIMLERKDCYITKKDVELAILETISEEKGASFSHFWDDGILEGSKIDRITIESNRKKILIAYSKVLRQTDSPNLDLLIEKSSEFGDLNIKSILGDFIRRNILLEIKNPSDEDIYIMRVPLFSEWLKEKGPLELSDAFSDQDIVYRNLISDEEKRIKPYEIIKLSNKWGNYKGRRVTDLLIKQWLDQFDNNYQQGLMLKILRNLRFYNDSMIRDKLEDAHTIVGKKILKDLGVWQQGEIFISYIGDLGKSSSRYVFLYKDQNNIPNSCVVEQGKIIETIEASENMKALVFIDDFIGTGSQAEEYLKKINEDYGDIFSQRKLLIFYIVIAGFQKALIGIDELLSNLKFKINFHILDTLEEKEKCFDENSIIFANETEKENARILIEEIGLELDKKQPLGYKNCQALVVFSDSCPNDTLPILWKKSTKQKKWIPLFPR